MERSAVLSVLAVMVLHVLGATAKGEEREGE